MVLSAPSVLQVVLIAIVPMVTFSAPEFQFTFGRIQGSDRLAQATQKPYNAYYGIPYAEPPIGQLRFRPPQPFIGRDSNAVISSSTYKPACFQNAFLTEAPISEDCLYLNIFTPTGTSGLKKVMLWIHGGAFVRGDASMYKPSRMVTDNDVIVVTIQYRLGAFGFLSSGPDDGNNALRDQILAIQWVKNNIRQFGGDPDDITIFGKSAGANCVSFLSISPLSKGLFTKAIMQSGTALNSFSNDKDYKDKLYQVANRLGCSNSWYFLTWLKKESYRSNLMECLRTKTAREIESLNQQTQIPSNGDSSNNNRFDDENVEFNSQNGGEDMPGFTEPISFSPYADGEVIPRDPALLMADKGYLQRVGSLDRDYIVGCNNNEGLLRAAFLPLETSTTPKASSMLFKSSAAPLFPLTTSINKEVMDLLEYQYGYPRDSSGKAPLQGLLDIFSDTSFVLPTILFARAMTEASDQTNVFVYLFDHYPEQSQPNSQLKGSNHNLDLCYEFDLDESLIGMNKFYANIPSPSDGNLAEIFRETLTTFAKTGNQARSNPEDAIYWPRFDPKQEYFLAISTSPEVRQHMYAKRMALWTDFLFIKGGVFYQG